MVTTVTISQSSRLTVAAPLGRSNCVMLSWKHGPTALRNASSALLDLCQEELQQF